jgi:hypothetical protein
MKSSKPLGALAAIGLIAMAGRADAGTILYNYETTVSFAAGTDALGLDGATLDIQVDVSSDAIYINRWGYAAVIMNNDATVTISGASIAANDGTFALPQLDFYPSFAGLFGDPTGLATTVNLPVGGSLLLQINTIATETGGAEVAGNTVMLSDFGPAASHSYILDATHGAYDQVNATATATGGTATLTPEPATLGLVFASFCALGLLRRFRTR